MAVKGRKLAALLVAAFVAIADADTDVPNWVSPINVTDSACYRKTYLSSETCAIGYESDGIASCWAQCPLNFPVECGAECIPQSSDCTSEVLGKVTSVATVALNAATAGVFGELIKASKALQLGVKCGQALFAATSSLVSYVDGLQANATQSEQLLNVVNQSDLVINELPAAVCTCLGLPVPTNTLELSANVVDAVNQIVTEVVKNGASLLDPSTFLVLMSDVGVDDSVQDLDTDSLTQLQDVLTAGTTCGTKLQTIIHKVTQFVAAIKTKNPSSTVSNIREALSVSDLFLKDIPAVTNNCIRNLTDDAFSVRDSLRTVMSTITDGLADGAADDDGNAISTSDYLVSVADMGLDVIATLDPTGIADMMATFIQPICGPTSFVGEIDDGSLADALALTTEDQAFNGSYGTWSKSGDGSVNITFKSTDTEDVTVVIHSGGDTVAEVDVASGETVAWNSTVKALQDQTLYLDRWRPGLLDVPGSGGGSLLMWVPRSSPGGKIELLVKINGDGGDDSAEQDNSEAESGDDDCATPAPTTSENEDQIQQMPISEEDDGSSDGAATTPAPTSVDNENVTPSPTIVDADQATKQSHKTASIRFHLASKGSSKYPKIASTMPQLIVALLRASNLPVADTFIQGNASDPFVTFQLGDEYLRSSCVSGALDPVWQPAETFEFEVGHQSQATDRQLVVHVVDNDRFKQDDLLGELCLPLSTFERRPNEAVVDTYELQVPEGLRQAAKHPDKKSTIQLDICFAEETDGQKTLCVWENEDYVDGKWTPSHSNERRHWSTLDLQVSSDNFDHVAPEVPEGLEGVGWAYSTKKGDDHGWIYASTYTGPWSSASSPICYARRRLWQNNCRPAVACE